MEEEFWKSGTGWVLLRPSREDLDTLLRDDPASVLLPYNVETNMLMIGGGGAPRPETSVPAMLRDSVPVIDQTDPRHPFRPLEEVEEFWKSESGWVLLRDEDFASLLPYNVETCMMRIICVDGSPTVPAMLRDGVPVIDRSDPRYPRAQSK